MERKTFFEVFPDVKLNSELTEIFEQVEVTRITANRDRTKLRIYIESSRLINKPAILSVENELCRQLNDGKENIRSDNGALQFITTIYSKKFI